MHQAAWPTRPVARLVKPWCRARRAQCAACRPPSAGAGIVDQPSRPRSAVRRAGLRVLRCPRGRPARTIRSISRSDLPSRFELFDECSDIPSLHTKRVAVAPLSAGHRSGNQVDNELGSSGMCFEARLGHRRSHRSPAPPSRTRISSSRLPTGTASPPSARCPTIPPEHGVVILPDVRGLYRFYEELALRFAERGIGAVAFDYFGRTAGIAKRGGTTGTYMAEVAETTPGDASSSDVGASGRVAARSRASPRSSRWASASGAATPGSSAAGGHGLAGAVGFYGSMLDRDSWLGPITRAAEMKAPILALQAGDDQNITADQNAAFDDCADRRRRSTMRSSPTRAHRTPSSIRRTRSSRTTPRTRGVASSTSSSGTARCRTARG